MPHYVTTDDGTLPTRWCDAANPYNEKAVLCRALENTVFVAASNVAGPDQGSVTGHHRPGRHARREPRLRANRRRRRRHRPRPGGPPTRPALGTRAQRPHRAEGTLTAVRKSPEPVPETTYYANGQVKYRGSNLDGKMHGPWAWYRTDGSAMRTGQFDRGRQVACGGRSTAPAGWSRRPTSRSSSTRVRGVPRPAAAVAVP